MGQDPLLMESSPAVVLRDLVPADLVDARRIVATAFAGEAFAVGMFGESPLARLVGMTNEYSSWPETSTPLVLAAEVAGLLIGVGSATRPGECRLCDGFDETLRPDTTPAARIERSFQLACRQAHLDSGLPPHGHIATVATDPSIQGAGVGRLVVAGLLDRLRQAGARCAVLECLTTRESFYRHLGFDRVVEFDDPGGPGLRSVLMRIDQ